jgi:transcriptional regulator with XRE-family HTH domain
MENIREILANNLKENRRRLGIPQPKLAEMADLSTHYVAMIESARKFPSPEVLGRLAAALGIAPHELFTVPPSPESALERLHRDIIKEIREVLTEILDRTPSGKPKVDP